MLVVVPSLYQWNEKYNRVGFVRDPSKPVCQKSQRTSWMERIGRTVTRATSRTSTVVSQIYWDPRVRGGRGGRTYDLYCLGKIYFSRLSKFFPIDYKVHQNTIKLLKIQWQSTKNRLFNSLWKNRKKWKKKLKNLDSWKVELEQRWGKKQKEEADELENTQKKLASDPPRSSAFQKWKIGPRRR